MKVILVNGSPRKTGNTYRCLQEIGAQLEKEGIDSEIFWLGNGPVRDCIGCGKCTDAGCIFADDCVNEFLAKAKEADGFVFGTPVYYAHPSGRILSFLDRVFYAGQELLTYKPGAAVTIARRGGTVASYDVINKYMGINQMPIVTSTYWNQAFGRLPDEAEQDTEGMQTMRNLARNMAWLLKCLEAGKKAGVALPATERGGSMHFIR